MPYLQTSIDFTLPYNTGVENQAILEVNRIHFNGQTAWVLDQLMKGRKVTGLMALQEYGIMDMRARIHSLKKHGIEISKESIKGANGARAHYMTPEQIEYNMEQLKKTSSMKTAQEIFNHRVAEYLKKDSVARFDDIPNEVFIDAMEEHASQWKYDFSKECKCDNSPGATWCCNLCGLPTTKKA